MKKNNHLGASIYYFTQMEYLPYQDPIVKDLEDSMGEVNEEVHYQCFNLKDGESMKGIAYHNEPYFPANIPAVFDSVNAITKAPGVFEIDKTISYEVCISAIKGLLDDGVPIDCINADMVKERMQEKSVQKVA